MVMVTTAVAAMRAAATAAATVAATVAVARTTMEVAFFFSFVR